MQLVTRKKMAEELKVSVNTFDKHYRYKKVSQQLCRETEKCTIWTRCSAG